MYGRENLELRSAVERLMQDLPVLPVCITSLLGDDKDSEAHMEKIVALAAVEPCLSVRIFQLAAKHFPQKQISGVAKALTMIGSSAVDELIEMQALARPFQPQNDEERCMWLHFIHVSVAADMLAREFKVLGVDPQQAAEAGLLHDVGRLVRYKEIAKSPSEIEAQGYRTPQELLDAEKKVFGTDHVEIGTVAMNISHAPDFLSVCVAHHHDKPDKLPRSARKHAAIIEIVSLADEMAMFCHRRPADDHSGFEGRCARFFANRSIKIKGLKPKQRVLNKIMFESLRKSQGAFDRLKLGPAPQLEFAAA